MTSHRIQLAPFQGSDGLVRRRENHCHNGARPSPTITASLSRGEQEARLEDVALAVSALSALVG
jgi:hypothetical protein